MDQHTKVIVGRDIGEAESNFDIYREVVNGSGLAPKNCEWVWIPGETFGVQVEVFGRDVKSTDTKLASQKLAPKWFFLYTHEDDFFGQTLTDF